MCTESGRIRAKRVMLSGQCKNDIRDLHIKCLHLNAALQRVGQISFRTTWPIRSHFYLKVIDRSGVRWWDVFVLSFVYHLVFFGNGHLRAVLFEQKVNSVLETGKRFPPSVCTSWGRPTPELGVLTWERGVSLLHEKISDFWFCFSWLLFQTWSFSPSRQSVLIFNFCCHFNVRWNIWINEHAAQIEESGMNTVRRYRHKLTQACYLVSLSRGKKCHIKN